MKKSLLAVAAMTAFAGAAQAQSSVTVYGILDVGYIGSNSSLTNTNTSTTANYNYGATATANSGATGSGVYANNALKQTQSLLGQSAEQTSRLGFKGTEDLGGGTSAFFTAEFGLSPEDQTLSGSTAGGLKNRQTFVGLKKNGLGDIAVGTQYTPIHIAVSKTDPGMQNNMNGSVIYTGQADSGVVGAYGGNQNAYTSRLSNTLTLNSEVLAGFQAHAMAILNNNNATAAANSSGAIVAGGNTNTNGLALGLDYTLNKLFVTANYQALKQLTSACNASNLSPVFGTTCTGAAASQVFNASTGVVSDLVGPTKNNPLNIQDNQAYVGATYDFGILKAYASCIQRKATDTANSGIYQKRSAEQIGVRSYITPTIEGWASAGIGTFTPMGMNQNSAHFNAWQLGSNYWLSKRTNLYAIFGQYAQANATYNQTVNASGVVSAGPYNTSLNANSYAVGVRHTF
jgi:predicted porin